MTEWRGRTTFAGKARRPVVFPKLTYFASHFGIPRCLRSAGQGKLVVKDSMVINDQPVVTLTGEHRRDTAGRVARDLELARLLVFVRFSSLSQQGAILTFFRWRGIDERGHKC